MIRHPALLALAAAASIATPFAASAQVDVGFLAGQSAQMGTSMYLADMVGRQSRARMRDEAPVVRGGPGPAPVRRIVAPAAALSYRPSPAVSQRSIQRFVDRAGRISGADGQRLKQSFASQNPLGKARQWLGKYGLSTSNVADCVAVYLTTAWLASRGSDADPSRADLLGVRAQVAEALRSTPGFARTSNATKQDMAESNLFQAMLLSDLAGSAKRNPSASAQVRQAAVRGARSAYGVDLTSLRLGPAGFVPA